MARVEMVTRTIEWTKVEVMALDVSSAEVINKVYTLSGHKEIEDALKAIQKTYDNATLKHVAINNRECGQTLYGLTVDEFIKIARVLPPRK